MFKKKLGKIEQLECIKTNSKNIRQELKDLIKIGKIPSYEYFDKDPIASGVSLEILEDLIRKVISSASKRSLNEDEGLALLKILGPDDLYQMVQSLASCILNSSLQNKEIIWTADFKSEVLSNIKEQVFFQNIKYPYFLNSELCLIDTDLSSILNTFIAPLKMVDFRFLSVVLKAQGILNEGYFIEENKKSCLKIRHLIENSIIDINNLTEDEYDVYNLLVSF